MYLLYHETVFGISIHAAREGGDEIAVLSGYTGGISIHAAREGGDTKSNVAWAYVRYFNPRRP